MSLMLASSDLERNEARAYASLFRLGAQLFGASDFRVESVADATALICPRWPRIPMFNRVIGLGSLQPIAESTLDELAALFDGHGIPLAVELPPNLLDAELKRRLRERSIRSAARTAVVAARAPMTAPVLGAWDARPALEPERDAVGSLCCSVFGVPDELQPLLSAVGRWPGWTQWIVDVEGQPAAAGLSFVDGSDCWLGWAATRPEFRGRGVKGALDRARVSGALTRGCTLLSSETKPDRPEEPSPSFRSWRRLGFELAYERHTLFRAPVHRAA